MDSEIPLRDSHAPVAPAPPADESAHDRHTRELNQSLETLEDTVEHELARVVKIAIPTTIGVIVAAVAVYVLGNRLRDRAERRRVARAIRHARSPH